MILKTERLILRPWNEEDAESLYEYARDPRVGPSAGWLVHTSVENSRRMIKNVLSLPDIFAVCLKEDNRAIGSIGLMTTNQSAAQEREQERELGYWIGVPFWGKGYIPEAVRRLQQYAFEELKCKAMWCGYFDGNERSRRVQEKCGFAYHHTVENQFCKLLSEVRTEHDTYLTREQWEKGRLMTETKRQRLTDRELERMVDQEEQQLSADGRYAAVEKRRTNAETGGFQYWIELWRRPAGPRFLLKQGNCRQPRFSPDGSRLAWISDDSGEDQVLVGRIKELEESGLMLCEKRRVTSLRHGAVQACWSPDGKQLAVESVLWREEAEAGQLMCPMNREEKRQWQRAQEWAPREITKRSYLQDAGPEPWGTGERILVALPWDGSQEGQAAANAVLPQQDSQETPAWESWKTWFSKQDQHPRGEITGKELLDANVWLKEFTLGRWEECSLSGQEKQENGYQSWICYPPEQEEAAGNGRRFPAILCLPDRETDGRADWLAEHWFPIQVLANAGYVVAGLQPKRQSEMQQRENAQNPQKTNDREADDLQACQALLTEVAALSFVEENQLGIIGKGQAGSLLLALLQQFSSSPSGQLGAEGSRQTLGKPLRIRAAVGQALLVNDATAYGNREQEDSGFDRKEQMAGVGDWLCRQAEQSPIRNVDQLETPLLLLHGAEDFLCPFEQSEQMLIARKERRPQIPVRLVMFPGEGHAMGKNGSLSVRRRMLQEVLDWMNRFMKQEGEKQ